MPSNSDVRYKIADLFGDRLSSYSHKQQAGNIYRFVAKNPQEAIELLRRMETYYKAYPKEIKYFLAYGTDNIASCPIVFHLGVRGYIGNSLLSGHGKIIQTK